MFARKMAPREAVQSSSPVSSDVSDALALTPPSRFTSARRFAAVPVGVVGVGVGVGVGVVVETSL